MNNLIKHKSIQIFFWILVIVTILFISNFNKGLEESDDSYVIIYSLYPESTIGRLKNFGVIGDILLKLSGYDLYYFRLLGFAILLFSSIIACMGIQHFFENKKKIFFDNKYLLLITSLAGSLCYYRWWMISPNYNIYNLIGALIYTSGMCFMSNNDTNLKSFSSYLLISLGLIICFISKPSTAFFLGIIFIIWNFIFYKKSFFKNIIFAFAFGSILFMAYVYFFFESTEFFVKDFVIGYKLLTIFDPRYGILGLFVFSVKWIVKHIIVDYWYVYIAQILLSLSIIKTKKFDFISLLFFLILILFYKNLNIFLFSIFLHLIFFLKIINLKQKEHLFIFFIALIIFFTSFGTNSNIDNHMQHGAIFYFILTIYLFKIYFKNFELRNFLIVIIFLSFTSLNLYNNIFFPHRYDENILHQKYKIQIPKLKGNIYVDEFTKNLKSQLDEIKFLIDEEKYQHLIDYTGRRPILNLLTGYEFITRPWWFSGYIGSDNYAKKVLKISNKEDVLNSLIIFQSNENLRKLKLENFEVINVNFYDKFELVGNIVVENNFKKDDLNLQLWKPKK